MVANFIPSDEHITITWIENFHYKIIFQFDFHTGDPNLMLLGTESAIFQVWEWILSHIFFFKENILCNSGGYIHAMRQ